MKKVNLNFNLQNVDGTESNMNAAKEVAKLLSSNHKSTNHVKAWEMSQRLYKSGVIELDTTDFEFLKKEIESFEGVYPILKGQVLLKMRD